MMEIMIPNGIIVEKKAVKYIVVMISALYCTIGN